MKLTKPYTTILFDLDGTLTDPEEGITRSFQYALHHFGIEEKDPARLREIIGPPLLESFTRQYGFSQIDALLAVDVYREYFSQTGIYENRLYPGVEEMLKTLQQAGKKLMLATSKPTVFANRILEHFNISQYFTFVAGSELNGNRSAKAEVIQWALATSGTNPRKAVMVGDRKHDIIGAIETNVDTIAVLYGYGSREELEEAGASFFAETPQQAAEYILSFGKEEERLSWRRKQKYFQHSSAGISPTSARGK